MTLPLERRIERLSIILEQGIGAQPLESEDGQIAAEVLSVFQAASRAPETAEAVVDNLVLRGRFNVGHTVEWNRALTDAIAAALHREREIAEVRLADVRITPSKLREKMDAAFSAATANNPFTYRGGSHGHCAVAAIIVRAMLGGEFVSATVNGQSHWFNRLGDVDIDITGDQFGLAPVRSAPVGTLHEGTLIRAIDALTKETIERAGRLLLAVNGLAT